MEKRGIGHVEVILAFVLFLTFIFAGFYFFNPLKEDRLLGSSLDYARQKIVENISVKQITYGLIINNTEGQISSTIVAINIGTVNLLYKEYVGNLSGDRIESNRVNDMVYIKKSTWSEKEILYIRFSEDISELASSVTALENSKFYTIASVKEEEVISEKRAMELESDYYDNYNNLKSRFNIPKRVEFGFILKFDNNEMIFADNSSINNEVFANSKRVKTLADGTNKFAYLIVKTW